MSISIYAMNYRNNSMQNKENGTKALTQTTEEEDIKTAELQQSIGTARLTKADIRQDGTVSFVQRAQGIGGYQRTQEDQTGQNFSGEFAKEQSYAAATRMDRAEISEEGRIANAKMQQQAGNVTMNQNTKGRTQEETYDNAEEGVEDFSEYTDAELKQMYYRGEITLQEYEDETGEKIE